MAKKLRFEEVSGSALQFTGIKGANCRRLLKCSAERRTLCLSRFRQG